MFFKYLLLPALLVTSINALPGVGPQPQPQLQPQPFCGSPGPTQEQIQASEAERANRTHRFPRGIKVDTYFHILATSDRLEDGYVTQETVDAQLAKINDAFAPHSISFNLIDTTWSINPHWGLGYNELEFKKTLRQGDYRALNVYFYDYAMQGLAKGGDYGRCEWPHSPGPAWGSDAFYMDGCTMCTATMPNGSCKTHNVGGIAAHEIGHWFYLLHTFQGGCEGSDLVNDTPPQAPSEFGACIEGLDTCPFDNEPDPIHNYMSYSGDRCYTQFTPGQEDRMYWAWELRQNSTQ